MRRPTEQLPYFILYSIISVSYTHLDVYKRQVKGPTSLIGQISSVGIRFDINGAVADVSGTATPEYFDANGNVLSDLGDSVKTVGGDVSYTMQILSLIHI